MSHEILKQNNVLFHKRENENTKNNIKNSLKTGMYSETTFINITTFLG